jgi:hypothetical protein
MPRPVVVPLLMLPLLLALRRATLPLRTRLIALPGILPLPVALGPLFVCRALVRLILPASALALIAAGTLTPLTFRARAVRPRPKIGLSRPLTRSLAARSLTGPLAGPSLTGRALPEGTLRSAAAPEGAALRGRAARAARPIAMWWFHCAQV